MVWTFYSNFECLTLITSKNFSTYWMSICTFWHLNSSSWMYMYFKTTELKHISLIAFFDKFLNLKNSLLKILTDVLNKHNLLRQWAFSAWLLKVKDVLNICYFEFSTAIVLLSFSYYCCSLTWNVLKMKSKYNYTIIDENVWSSFWYVCTFHHCLVWMILYFVLCYLGHKCESLTFVSSQHIVETQHDKNTMLNLE